MGSRFVMSLKSKIGDPLPSSGHIYCNNLRAERLHSHRNRRLTLKPMFSRAMRGVSSPEKSVPRVRSQESRRRLRISMFGSSAWRISSSSEVGPRFLVVACP